MKLLVLSSLLPLLATVSVRAFLFQYDDSSCYNRCGDNDNSKPCQCNTACENYGDCCSDYNTHCTDATCNGRCDNYDSSRPCQCNSGCENYGDCCSDYSSLCTDATCNGRCGDNDSSKPCQCNSACSSYGDCCSDYVDFCENADGGSAPVCKNFDATAKALWDSDVDRLSSSDFTIQPQGQVYSNDITDNANNRLFSYVDESKLTSAVYSTYLSLLDNFNPYSYNAESLTSTEEAEQEAFLGAVLATPVMDELFNFFLCEGYVSSASDFRQQFEKIWFEFYNRKLSSTAKDTNGFEHVMLGELENSDIGGVHFWLFFYEMEKTGDINYYGYAEPFEDNVASVSFSWNGREKSKTSFFLGTSPAYDLAVYTLCYYVYEGRTCYIDVDGDDQRIITYDSGRGGHIGTAYIQ